MATNELGETVLHRAANHIDIVKYLINECHCDPMATDSNNKTTLHKAAQRDSSDVAKYLINEKHCDPMTVDSLGQTPLHIAAYWNNPAVVEYLLSTASHMDEVRDEVSNLVEWRKEEIQKVIVREKCDSVFLDCRKLGGSGLDSLFKMLSSA
ncbi:PREDICTED: uncharacterized protein LOC105315816, partial [Amphimedon queenslandica]|uniref:Uncharacterized protein n=1 Tax=Amphimedon queenslandica TaxID=400682 RepID=A0AAN0ISG9_AMPQE